MNSLLRVLALLLMGLAPAAAQTYFWTTLAGQATPRGGTDAAGTNARFDNPCGITTDAAGNLYVADTSNYTVRKITSAGVVTTIAGDAGVIGSADGQGKTAHFSSIYGIVVGANGDVFVSDYDNNTIRRITPAGMVTTVAGSAGQAGSTDGTGTTARFRNPVGLAFDSSGNLFVADRNNRVIRKLTSTGEVSTVAGLAGVSGTADGTGSNARFSTLSGLAIDGSDNLYASENSGAVIRRITPAGVVSTVAGLAGTSGTTNAVGTAARFSFPNGLAVDAAGNVLVADTTNNAIRQIAPDGTVTTFAGGLNLVGSADGAASAARFYYPYGIAVDRNGNVFVADTVNQSIRRITSAGVTTIAGPGGNFGSTDGSGSAARFNLPAFAAVDQGGNVFVTDSVNATIRKITPTGSVTTFVGTVGSLLAADGTGASGRFSFPMGLSINGTDTLVATDTIYGIIRLITPGGTVTTIAGQGTPLVTGSVDGNGPAARFNQPRGLAVDRNNNIYVADYNNQTIRKVTFAGEVTTLAGAAGVRGSTDGTGTAARFSSPWALATDVSGNVYVAEYGNHTIRKITSAGAVSTLAGLAGTAGFADGNGAVARFYGPTGLAVDGDGNIFIVDSGNNAVRKLTPAGTVTTIGGEQRTFLPEAADGRGTAARFNAPSGIAIDAAGALYVVDALNNRIVKGVPEVRPTITLQPRSLPVAPNTRVTFNVGATGGGLSYQWFVGSIAIGGATTSTLTIDAAQPANAGLYTVAVYNSAGSVTSAAAALTVVNTTDTGRISNLAIRSQAGTGGQTLIVGLAIGGAGTSGTKPLLIRGVGPALGAFGLTGFLADPRLEVYSNATAAKINENNDWNGDSQVSAASASVGAFSLGAGNSRDAALYLPTFSSGSYTVQVSGAGNSTGVALAEIYDAAATSSFTAITPRLINVSARTQVGTGGEVLIAGFYIGGQTSKTVLIRAIGPTLTAFGVPGALADPMLELFTGTTKINENDNWGGDAALSAAFGNVGAFPLSPTGKDAALLVTLAPGSYTAQISGVGNTTGVALVEVYEVP